MSTPRSGVRAWRPRKTDEAIVIGSERILDEAEALEFEQAPPGIESSPDSNGASLDQRNSPTLARRLRGRLVTAGAVIAVVGVIASVFVGESAEEVSTAGDELAAREAPSAGDRMARAESRTADSMREGGGTSKWQPPREAPAEGQAPRSPTHHDRTDTAPVTGTASEGSGEETAATPIPPPVVGSAPVAPAPSAPVLADGDAGGAVVPASGAEVRQEFGP